MEVLNIGIEIALRETQQQPNPQKMVEEQLIPKLQDLPKAPETAMDVEAINIGTKTVHVGAKQKQAPHRLNPGETTMEAVNTGIPIDIQPLLNTAVVPVTCATKRDTGLLTVHKDISLTRKDPRTTKRETGLPKGLTSLTRKDPRKSKQKRRKMTPRTDALIVINSDIVCSSAAKIPKSSTTLQPGQQALRQQRCQPA